MMRITLPANFLLCVTCGVAVLANSASSQAQQVGGEVTEAEHGKDWYYGSNSPVVEQKSIARRKSEARAQQRMARLEAYRWLGYSPSRPPSAVIPFTSTNSLAWKKAERAHYPQYSSLRFRTFETRPYYGFY